VWPLFFQVSLMSTTGSGSLWIVVDLRC